MGIIGAKPERGVRVALERRGDGYAGTVTTPDAEWNVIARIDAAREVVIESDAPAAIAERVRLIIRTALRHDENGDALPRFIRRWRDDPPPR